MKIKLSDSSYSYEEKFGIDFRVKIQGNQKTLNYYYFTGKELKMLCSSLEEINNIRENMREEEINDKLTLRNHLSSSFIVYVWIAGDKNTQQAYIGQSTDGLKRIYKHHKQNEISNLWIFEIPDEHKTTDLLKALENKIISLFKDNKIKYKNVQEKNNESQLGSKPKKEAEEFYKIILQINKIFSFNFINVSKELNISTVEKTEDISKSEEITTNQKPIEAHNNEIVSHKNTETKNEKITKENVLNKSEWTFDYSELQSYHHLNQKIYLYVIDSSTIIVKKGSYIRDIKSIENVKTSGKREDWPRVLEIRRKYGISDEEHILSEDITFIGVKIVDIIRLLTTYIRKYSRILAHIKNKIGDDLLHLSKNFK
ncbi:GIY-YIG nuclease family protein [Mesomycoplasma hyorhinis]|uniref:GIY-YIG nuclease family protein n=1 Tax=Mesomycoplasma hyorhinis TaxID=2100 RepID=UPI001C04332D|nr:GIY-YIG nuclease family protein [Mesomycoplasma hyorhinis]